MKSNPAITPSTRPRAAAEAADSVPPPGATRVRARGEHGGEVVGGEGRGLPPAPVGGRAAVARQHPRGAFPGGRGLAGELGPEVRGLDGLRGGAGGAARLEHVGEVGTRCAVAAPDRVRDLDRRAGGGAGWRDSEAGIPAARGRRRDATSDALPVRAAEPGAGLGELHEGAGRGRPDHGPG